MSENRFRKGDWTNCRYDICEIVTDDDEIICVVALNDVDKIIGLLEENEQLRKENVFLAKQRTYWKSKCSEWMGVKEENLSLRCVKISEKRFSSNFYEEEGRTITDNGNELTQNEVVDLLNEMNEDIQYLNAFLVEQGLAEEYIRWKGAIDDVD